MLGAKKSIQFITNKKCPFAQKAWVALETSGCEYEMKEISLYGSGGKPQWFWQLNPRGTVPVLSINDGAEVYADSEDILDVVQSGMLESEGLLSTGDEVRESVVEWRRQITERLIPVGRSAVLGGSVPKLRSLLREFDAKIKGPYLTGGEFTSADAAMFPFIWRIDKEFTVGQDGEEKIKSWLNQCLSIESVKKESSFNLLHCYLLLVHIRSRSLAYSLVYCARSWRVPPLQIPGWQVSPDSSLFFQDVVARMG